MTRTTDHPPSRAPRRLAGPATALALLVLAACGEDPAPSPEAAPGARIDLPAVDDADRARFALDRLLEGPVPRSQAFAIPRIHRLNLEHAVRDLAALEEHTLRLLADEALVRRVTSARRGQRNPWHGILDVLLAIESPPPDVVLPWIEPLVTLDDVQLRRRAARLLLVVDGPEAAALAERLLRVAAADREAGPLLALRLAAEGPAGRRRAAALTLRDGSAWLWEALDGVLARNLPDRMEAFGPADHAAVDALAWWALLAETSGPPAEAMRGRSLTPAWAPLGLALQQTARSDAGARTPAAVDVRPGGSGPPSAERLDAWHTLPTPPEASAVLPSVQVLLTGRGPSADARCRLAGLALAPAQAAVRHDLEAADPVLAHKALHCGAWTERPYDLAAVRAALDEALVGLRERDLAGPASVPDQLGLLSQTAPEEAFERGWSLLRAARPVRDWIWLIEQVHDLLRGLDPERTAQAVAELDLGAGGEETALALHLIRRSRDPAHIPVLREALARADTVTAEEIHRLLVWLHTAPGVEPARWAGFVEDFTRWLDEGDDARIRGLAPTLLDMGPPGAQAFARGLAGSRRGAYVDALAQVQGVVPLEVAEALLAGLDEQTPPEERRRILIIVYRSAPAGAAEALARARTRLPRVARHEVDDILLVLRHRAQRPHS